MEKLDAAYAALADPTRRAILARLALGEATVGEIAEPFPISGPAISRHLKVLEEAELIARTRRGQQLVCRLNPEGLRTAQAWLDYYRAYWTGAFDRLDEHLKRGPVSPISEKSSGLFAGRTPNAEASTPKPPTPKPPTPKPPTKEKK